MAETETQVSEVQRAFDAIGELLHKHGIENAVVLIRDPKPPAMPDDEREPHLFFRGDFYEAARLMAFGSTTVRLRMNADLRGL